MSKINYPVTSPYGTTNQSDTFIGRYRHRSIPLSKDDQQLTITARYDLRPDLLSYDLYGTVDYWWVFVVRNPSLIRDPIWDFTLGMTIWVPSQDHLQKVVG